MVVFGQNGCIREKMVVILQSGCIRESGCNRAKVVVLGQNGFIRANVGVFRKKWLYSGKVIVLDQK